MQQNQKKCESNIETIFYDADKRIIKNEVDLRNYILEIIELNIDKSTISDNLIVSSMIDEPDTRISINSVQ